MLEGYDAITVHICVISNRRYSVETVKKWPSKYGMPVERAHRRVAQFPDVLTKWWLATQLNPKQPRSAPNGLIAPE